MRPCHAHPFVLVLSLLGLLMFTGAYALAQTPDTSTLRGVVTDQTGAAIPDAQITVTNTSTGLQRRTATDSAGRFALGAVPVSGAYEIKAEKQAFAPAELANVTLIASSTANLTIQMRPAGESTEITVTGVAGEVRTDAPQLGTDLGALQIEKTPALNRRVTYLPLLNAANRPAINQGDIFTNQFLFTTNGAGRRQAFFETDGGNSIDMWGRQTVFSAPPQDTVQEMDVLTNAFSAEYGAGVGSVINMVTKTGSNTYHGSLLGMWRPAKLGAKLSGFTPTTNVTSGNQITSDLLEQAAATLAGPINKTTQFFVSGEYSRQNRVSPITSTVAPGSFVGHYRGWLALARLDHQINDKNNVFLRLNADSFRDTNPNGIVGGNSLPTVARTFTRRTYQGEIGETATISPTLMNTARLQFQLASPITQFDPAIFGTQFQVPITGVGTFTTGTSQSALLMNRQYEVTDTVSATHSRHILKFGGDMVHAHNGGNSKEFGGPITLGQFVYKACTLGVATCESAAFLGNIANVASYRQDFGNINYTVDDTLWSLFVQDDYHLRQNLTVNLGMRYERQTFTDSTKDFAPRVGFAWDPHNDGKMVFRGGFGIYYSQIPDNAEANYALGGPTGVISFTATPGQAGFPTSVSAAPLPTFPTGSAVPIRSLYLQPGRPDLYGQFLNTAALRGYPDALLNPYSEQWTFGIQRELAPKWVLSMDYVGSRTLRINRPLDVDTPAPFIRTATSPQTRTAQAANCTRPLWVGTKACGGTAPAPLFSTVLTDVNDGYANYNAFDVSVSHRFSRHGEMLLSYTWSHTLDNVDPDVPGQNPNDPNFTGREEYGNAIYDQRHRVVLSGAYYAPFKINVGGVTTLATGLPFNIVTGNNNSGDPGATTDRPVIHGAVVGRNTGRGLPIYEVNPFVERAFALGTERVRLNLRAEAFNVFNHANFVGYTNIFGNNDLDPTKVPKNFGLPATGVSNQLPARSFQFQARLQF
jgi:hypothetical protein